jgi:hypothetical protein
MKSRGAAKLLAENVKAALALTAPNSKRAG